MVQRLAISPVSCIYSFLTTVRGEREAVGAGMRGWWGKRSVFRYLESDICGRHGG